jgi:death-on-curing family protein
VDKAAVLGDSIIQNHPFLDGNKRAGHAAMEVFLFLNGREIQSSVDEQERVILRAASAARVNKPKYQVELSVGSRSPEATTTCQTKRLSAAKIP